MKEENKNFIKAIIILIVIMLGAAALIWHIEKFSEEVAEFCKEQGMDYKAEYPRAYCLEYEGAYIITKHSIMESEEGKMYLIK